MYSWEKGYADEGLESPKQGKKGLVHISKNYKSREDKYDGSQQNPGNDGVRNCN
jgi:hypothetical protein